MLVVMVVVVMVVVVMMVVVLVIMVVGDGSYAGSSVGGGVRLGGAGW